MVAEKVHLCMLRQQNFLLRRNLNTKLIIPQFSDIFSGCHPVTDRSGGASHH
jgi:hypothetical protein